MNDKIKKIVSQTMSVFFAAVIVLLALTGCIKNDGTINIQVFAKEAMKDIYPADPEKQFHVMQPDTAQLKFIAKSGLIEIYLDESTYSVAVCETLKKQYWYSLPLMPDEGAAAYDYSAAPVSLSIVNGSETYYLNSQDNAVAYGNVKSVSLFAQDDTTPKPSAEETSEEKEIAGIQVNYIITPDKETAAKDKFDETDIAFLVSLSYTLKDGSLYVSSKNTNLSGNKDAVIRDVELLEFFGASSVAQPGDFLLTPDGSGALIYTAVEQPDFNELTFQVYAGNQSSGNGADEKNAVIAAYGIKKGENAFAALIEKGDAIASISADRSAGKSGFNKIGASFDITEIKDVEKNGKIFRYTGNDAYTDDIEICLRFLSGGNASYSGMAAVCREQLIRDSKLSTKTLDKGEYLPFNLTVIGAVKKDIINNIPIQSTAELTAFDQAQDMLTRMKSKGVNSIFLRYTGALDGGLNQTDISGSGILRSLGGKKGFTELCTYMKTQKMELFLDVSLLSSKKSLLTVDSETITAINNKNGYTQTKNALFGYIGDEYFTQNLRPISGIDKAVLKTLTGFKKMDLSGFCLNDAGRILYSDYSGNGYNLQSAANTVAEKITSLSTGKKIMIDTGNFFAIKNADVIMNIPMLPETGEEENIPYQYVPFIQLILHGIVDYSGVPINRSFIRENNNLQAKDLEFGSLNGQEQKGIKDMMLKHIEYGACPSYEWTYEELDKKSVGVETFYYDEWINQAVDFYLKANAALADIRASRMVKHSQIQPGVFRTEYEGSKLVYVNYTFADVDVGGVTVKARDFIRI